MRARAHARVPAVGRGGAMRSEFSASYLQRPISSDQSSASLQGKCQSFPGGRLRTQFIIARRPSRAPRPQVLLAPGNAFAPDDNVPSSFARASVRPALFLARGAGSRAQPRPRMARARARRLECHASKPARSDTCPRPGRPRQYSIATDETIDEAFRRCPDREGV